MTRRIAFLGPPGTFCEAALLQLVGDAADERVAMASVPAAIDAVRDGACDLALVPIENSVEGSVSVTLDLLSTGSPLVIIDEVVLPVTFALMARPGTSVADITGIGSHPHALAQVRGWAALHAPTAVLVSTLSTAGAAESLAAAEQVYDAAVAPALAAERYGLAVLESSIGDEQDAATRFVLVARPGALPAPTGADKTTLTLFMRLDQPGALMEILNEFAVRGVNLTRIESRPTRKAMGDYFFSVDIEGHIADARVAEALMGLHRICLDVRFLGSYARHDGREPVLRYGVTDADFAEASGWLDRLKGGDT